MFEIEINRQSLLKNLNLHVRSTAARQDLEILNSVLIEADLKKSKIILRSTDLNQAIVEEIDAKINSAGMIALPAKLSVDLLGSITDEVVVLKEESGNKLHIQTSHNLSTLNLMDPSDYPETPDLNFSKTVKLNAGELKESIAKVLVAASKDTSRPILCGVLFWLDLENKLLRLAATDSYRLAERCFGYGDVLGGLESFKAVMPLQSTIDLQKIVAQLDDQDEVLAYCDGDQIGFKCNSVVIVSRVVDGQYPEYLNLIPSKSDIKLVVDRLEFLQAVKVAAIFSRESAGTVSLIVDGQDQTLTIDSVANQIGENKSSITVDSDGSGEINLNSRYLVEAVATIESDLLGVEFSRALTPFVLRPSEQKGHLHIIMPINN